MNFQSYCTLVEYNALKNLSCFWMPNLSCIVKE